MMVMCGRGHNLVHYWAGKLPNSIGQIHSPPKPIPTFPWMEYAIDNGQYAVYAAGRPWDADEFLEFCEKARHLSKAPLWVVVPDTFGDAEHTGELWAEWAPRLRRMGFRLAFVAQTGLLPEQVPTDADVIFMGGADEWKFAVLESFISIGKPVHVGRVNGNRLWQCYRAGAASCDGSGWFRGDRQQLAKLERFLQFRVGELGLPGGGQLDLSAMYFDRKPRLPENIERSHLIMAMEAWWDVPRKHQAARYAIAHQNRLYPVKMVVARANLFANGYCLDPRSFSGGREANRFVQSRGLEVVRIC